jgi:DNA repair protein RadC
MINKNNEPEKNNSKIENSSIKNWREDDRPRERLIKYGTSALSDSEILAILLGSGTVGKSAVDVSRALLQEFASLTDMAKSSTSQFMKVEGIGIAKAVLLTAAFELSRRIAISPFDSNKQYDSPDDLADYYIPRLRDSRVETFRTILLNSKNCMIREYVISEGILNSTLVHPREVFRPAILESAASIILLHNHPSGWVEPSKDDKIITEKLVKTGETIGINVIDHIIIGGSKFFSFKQMGLI